VPVASWLIRRRPEWEGIVGSKINARERTQQETALHAPHSRTSIARVFQFPHFIFKDSLVDPRFRASNYYINGPSELARTSPQGGGLDLSLTARIDRARPLI